MPQVPHRPWLHRLFRIGVVVKAVDGLLEISGGLFMVLLGPGAVGSGVAFLTQHELSEDPQDLLANFFVGLAGRPSADTVHFAAAYLLGHGLVKTWLAAGLLREKEWAFPPAMAFLGLFISYQVYRIGHTGSIGLTLLTVVDAGIALLVWKEYVALRGVVERPAPSRTRRPGSRHGKDAGESEP